MLAVIAIFVHHVLFFLKYTMKEKSYLLSFSLMGGPIERGTVPVLLDENAVSEFCETLLH